MKLHQYPRIYKTSEKFIVTVNGKKTHVLKNIVSDFLSFDMTSEYEKMDITVELHNNAVFNAEYATVRPVSRGVESKIVDNKMLFTLTEPGQYVIDIDGSNHKLLLFVNPYKEEGEPCVEDTQCEQEVLFYAAGQVYEVGEMELFSNQTMYIEAGAVVRGVLYTRNAHNVKIAGRGILDGDFFQYDGEDKGLQTIQINASNDVTIEDITIINPRNWVIVLGGSDGVVCQNVKILGYYTSTDGIDVVGCSNVLIKGCFIQNNDDSIVIKAFAHPVAKTDKWDNNVKNIICENNVFLGDRDGNILEIGHEIFCDVVENVVFRDSDVVKTNGFSAVFSIQHAGSALIKNVLYENINIEHCYEKVLNIQTMQSRYTDKFMKNSEFGYIDGVVFKNINWQTTVFNKGYTVSLIGGANEEHKVKNVTFDNFLIDGKPARRVEDLNIFSRNCEGIVFK